jgi:pSer/pThr/pTyr-binding forkhead associated (FHA) protein
MVMGKGDETSKAISLDDDDVDEAEETSADAVDTEAPPERSAAEPTPKRRPPPNGPKRESVQLEVIEPKHRERVYRLRGRPVVIGRSQEADISLKDTKASRRHLRIELVEDRIMAEDLGSQNGTRVNDRLIRSRELMSGDVITIGRTEIRVQRIAE